MIRSIRTKLFLFTIGVMVAYAIIGIVLNMFFLKPYYIRQNKSTFQDAVTSLRSLSSLDSMMEHVAGMTSDTGMFLTITNQHFEILASSNNVNDPILHPDVLSAILQKEDGSKTIYTISEGIDATSKLIYMEMIDDTHRIVVTKSISVIDENIQIVNHFYLLTGLIVLVVGSVAVYVFSRTLTTPIIKISQIAQNISELNFDQKVAIHSKDELGVLARSINKLSDDLNRSLQQLQKDVSFQKMLSRNVSHELKTPVAVIKGHTEGLLYGIASSKEDQQKYLQVIVDECDRMDHLVKDMLMLSRLSVYDRQGMPFESIDTALMCQTIKERFCVIFEKKGIAFDLICGKDFCFTGNRLLIEHAITNYLSNAIKYGTGTITLRFDRQKDWNVISVSNEGETIAEAELPLIFEPFYKLTYARKNQNEGHGLGLAIVKSIMDIHQGNAYAKNDENGITFVLEIPVV